MPSLKDKITSLEQYLEVELPNGALVRSLVLNDTLVLGKSPPLASFVEPGPAGDILQHLNPMQVSSIPKSMWWLHRELMRVHHGIYMPPTQLIKRICSLAQWAHYAPHMSVNDPNNVGFTPTVEYGLADRQVSIALGRFLRKTNLALTDHMIARMEARHRLELNPDVEFIVAVERPDDFYKAYQSLASCMAKPPSHFATPIHPIRCYCVPGWQLAMLKNEGGGNSARSLVWVNPEDVTDKRYVRTYGDQVLEGYLLSHGFRRRGFHGAKVATQVITEADTPDGQAILACPYIDTGTNAETTNGYGLWDGGDMITLQDVETATQQPRLQPFLFSVQQSGARASARQFSARRICAITGVEFNTLDEEFVAVMLDASSPVVHARKSVVDERGWTAAFYNASQIAFHPPEVGTFSDGYRNYLDTPTVRRQRGYVQLSERYYPNDRGWLHHNADMVLVEESHWCKKDDVVGLIEKQGETVRLGLMHKCRLLKSAVRVAPKEYKTYAADDVPILRTNTNRKVVKGIHEVIEGWDGQWYFSRSMREYVFIGEPLYIPRDGTLHVDIQLKKLPPQAKRRFDQALVQANLNAMSIPQATAICVFEVMNPNGSGIRAPTVDRAPNGLRIWGLHRSWQSINVDVLDEFLRRPKHDEDLHPNAYGPQSLNLWSIGRLVKAMLEKAYIPPPPEQFHEPREPERAEPAAVGPEVREPERVGDGAASAAPAVDTLDTVPDFDPNDGFAALRRERMDNLRAIEAGLEAERGGEGADL